MQPWTSLPTPQNYLEQFGAKPSAIRSPGFGGNDWAEAELWIHTGADQYAVAPGRLLERSVEGQRAHHHFKTEGRIQAFFPIISGRYQVEVAYHGDTRLELYFHPDHAPRVEHLIWSMQRSLAYFEQHWGPYPNEVLRLAEVPGFAGSAFACSFPGGMLGFTDSMGFRCPKGEGKPIHFPERSSTESSVSDLDPVLWIVAHEVAHQWWDSHVIAAMALGASFTSESLAQYGSLCVVQAEYGEDMALRIAEYNRTLYLDGRRRADRKEMPLVLVDDQSHLHYGKGYMAFHALAKMVGHKKIDRVLSGIIKEFAGAEGMPVTSLTIVERLIEGLPPELEPRIKGWFEEIRFVDGRVKEASVTRESDMKFTLVVVCTARSLLADGNGEESIEPFTGELELEVLLNGRVDPVRLIAPSVDGRFRFEATFPSEPLSVHLDPRLLHVDRDLSDNHKFVVEQVK